MTWKDELKAKYPNICFDIRCGADLPKGWRPIIEEYLGYISDLCLRLNKDIQITQIKIKWHQLRIYWEWVNKEARDNTISASVLGIINLAESSTRNACWECGKWTSGKRLHNNLCSEHGGEDD